jgi:uncharacterized MAPEG superfamily protein
LLFVIYFGCDFLADPVILSLVIRLSVEVTLAEFQLAAVRAAGITAARGISCRAYKGHQPMTIPHLCLLIVALLPFPWTMLAKVSQRYDNRTPRAYLAGLEGWRARAHAAHQNAWEALAMFTAAIVVAGQAGGSGTWINWLAITFVVARVLHGVLYVANLASLRSLVWFVGVACVVSMFFVSTR